MVGAVTTEPVVQEIADKPFGVLITNPVGRVSEKLIAESAAAFGFVNVNVRVLALPCAMVVGENAFESVGTTGRGQPLMTTLSRAMEETTVPPVPFMAVALIRNLVVALDVAGLADAIFVTVVKAEVALPTFAAIPVGAVCGEYHVAPPSVLAAVQTSLVPPQSPLGYSRWAKSMVIPP